MINVDVYIPSMDRSYNCNLDEEVPISMLIDELSELICKKEHSTLQGDRRELLLGSLEKQLTFRSECSLRQYSIKNGDSLILM